MARARTSARTVAMTMVKRLVNRYGQFVPLVVFVAGSIWLFWQSWGWYFSPRLLDTNPVVYAQPLPGWLFPLVAAPIMVSCWLNLPIPFLVLYAWSALVLILLYTERRIYALTP